jgi:hypothetical protein
MMISEKRLMLKHLSILLNINRPIKLDSSPLNILSLWNNKRINSIRKRLKDHQGLKLKSQWLKIKYNPFIKKSIIIY